MHVHTYIPPASMTTGRRTTTRRTAERFICEGTIASYMVEVSTLKKTERANLLRSSLEKSVNHLTKSGHIYILLTKKNYHYPTGRSIGFAARKSNSKTSGQQVTGDVLFGRASASSPAICSIFMIILAF